MRFNQIYNHKYELIAEGVESIISIQTAFDATRVWGTVYYVVPLIDRGSTAMEYKIEYDSVMEDGVICDTQKVDLYTPDDVAASLSPVVVALVFGLPAAVAILCVAWFIFSWVGG